jgi:hypothetical protein
VALLIVNLNYDFRRVICGNLKLENCGIVNCVVSDWVSFLAYPIYLGLKDLLLLLFVCLLIA